MRTIKEVATIIDEEQGLEKAKWNVTGLKSVFCHQVCSSKLNRASLDTKIIDQIR